MSYLKVWNEKVTNFDVFDIGHGRFRVNSKDWVIAKMVHEPSKYEIIKFEPEDDESGRPYGRLPEDFDLNPNFNITGSIDDFIFDISNGLENVKDYRKLKIIHIGINKFDGFDFSMAVPYGSPIYHVNENGQTIDRY